MNIAEDMVNNIINNFKLALYIITVLVLVIVAVTGCVGGEASSENGVVSEITMSTAVDTNNRPINPTTVFSVDAENLFCSFRLSGFPVGAELEAQWIYIGGDPEAAALTGTNYVAETQTAIITKT